MGKRIGRTSLALAAALVASGCASTSLRRAEAPSIPERGIEREAAWIHLQCGNPGAGDGIGTQVIGPIGAVVGGIAVDFAVNFAKAALEQQQKGRNSIFAASGAVQNCAMLGQSEGTLHINRAIIDQNGARIFGRTDRPGFSLQGRLTFATVPDTAVVGKKPKPPAVGQAAADEKKLLWTVTFTPTLFIYGQTAAPVRGKGRKHVVVLLALSENSPLKAAGSPTEEQLGTVLRIDLGTLRDGRFYEPSMLETSAATATFGRIDAEKLTATALVFESEDESMALKALSDAFGSNSDALKKALRDLIGIEDSGK
jgi:hypothetical protein